MNTQLEVLFKLDPHATFDQDPWWVYKNNFYWVYQNKHDWLKQNNLEPEPIIKVHSPDDYE